MNSTYSTYHKFKRMFANILSVLAIVAVAIPVTTVAYAAPKSPFLGQWQAIDVDGSDIRLAIAGGPGGPFQITWTESYISFCDRAAGMVRGTGWLDESDQDLLEADLRVECFTKDATLDFHLQWRYYPTTNTLSGRYDNGTVTIWRRPGTSQLEPPVLNLRVNYGDDWVESFYEGGHTAWVTVTESDGVTVKATAEVVTEPKDWWGGEPGFNTRAEDWVPAQPDIQPNDWVLAWIDNGASAQVQIGDIGGVIDLTGDSIQGTISALWFSDELEVECHSWGSPSPIEILKYDWALPNAEDTYSCSWSGEWDIQPGQDVGVGYLGPDGNWVANAFSVPNANFVAYVPGVIEGYDWPMGHTITININDGEYTHQASSEQRPDFPEGVTRVLFELWRDNFSIKAGDHIVMKDETAGITKEVVVTNLAVTDVDINTGTVSGVYDPAYDLWVWLYGQEPLVPMMNPDNRTWTATFTELSPGALGGAVQHDIDGDGTSIDFQVAMPFIITSLDDVIADDGICTLREAIIAANTNAPSGNTSGECPAGLDSQTDTITLVAGNKYSLTIDRTGEDTAADGDLDILDNSSAIDLVIKVQGDGKVIISQDAPSIDDRVLENHEANVRIEYLIISGGSNVGGGGGILNNGTMDIAASEVSGNSVGWDGGGIYNSSVGTMTIDSTTITGNTSVSFAGGIMNKGVLTVSNSEIRANTDVHGGGGINNEGTLMVVNSIFSANSSGQGGALYNSGTANILNSVVGGSEDGQGNTVNDGGGGLFNVGTMVVESSIVAGNWGPYGGGLFNWIDGMLTISNTTVSGNSANQGAGLTTHERSTTVIQNGSIIIGNTANWAGGGVNNWGILTITESVLRGNTSLIGVGNAINSDVNLGTAMSITGSCIIGNGGTAIFNSKPVIQIATDNWWGASSGPSGAGPGLGDSVSDNVDFSNWLTTVPALCAP